MKTIYRATRVHTQSSPALAEWVLVDQRHVERVGSGDPPPADRIVDLPGTTIVPGFVDAHVHLTGTGVREGGLDLGAARSAGDLLEMVRTWVENRPAAVLGQGFDETKWDGPEVPTLADLDAACPEPLILVRADGHVSLANTPALRESGALDAEGAERDAGGDPTGRASKDANAALQRWYFDQLGDHDVEEAQLQGAAVAAARGVTCVHEMSIPTKRGRRDIEVLMRQRTRLPTDVIAYLGEFDIPFAMDLGIARIGGDLFLDGSIGARTAALGAPYVDGEGSGLLYHEDDDLAEGLHNAHLAGMQVGLHAIGDSAIEQAIRIWERVYRSLDSRLRRHFRARRHRIEHLEMVTGAQIERAAALGLSASIQPAFDSEWGWPGAMYELRLGAARAEAMNPFRSLMERGMEVGAGSDSPVTPLDPMAAVWALERHHDGTQRLSREEAIRLCTIGAARLAHLEDKKGRLEPGMQADLAAFDGDPFAVEDVRGLRPVLTVSQGREVYAA